MKSAFGNEKIAAFIVDCFFGQILTGILILAFCTLFFLREWILQHAVGTDFDAVHNIRGAEAHIHERHEFQRAIFAAHNNQRQGHNNAANQQQNLIGLDAVQLPPVNNNLAAADQDAIDIDVAEDIDNLLEILGFRGSPFSLFRQVIFILGLIVAAIGSGVFLPYILGKCAVILSLNSSYIYFRLPIKIISIVGDLLLAVIVVVFNFFMKAVIHFLPLTLSPLSYDQFYFIYLSNSLKQLITNNGHQSISSRAYAAFYFATTFSQQLTVLGKIFVVALGYMVFCLLGASYLTIRRSASSSIERIFKESLRQSWAVLKTLIIISIELVAFPIFCGVVIDLSTFPLWKEVSIMSRSDYMQSHPITMTFQYWFVGTVYMFHFALFVGMIREVIRPGVLYMIRDPNDPSFHPIREILDRTILSQAKKIAFSAVVYFTLITSCF